MEINTESARLALRTPGVFGTLENFAEAVAVLLAILLVGVGTAAVSSGQVETPRSHSNELHPAGSR